MKKAIAIILTAVMVILTASCASITITMNVDEIPLFSALANKGGSGNTNVPSSSDVTPSSSDSTAETPSQSTPAETPSQSTPAETPSQSTPAETPSQSAQKPAEEKPAASGAPSTKEEVIAYYNAAYNKMGTDGAKIVRTYDYTSNYNKILSINNNSTLESLATTLMDKFMVENTEPLESSFADFFPAGVTNLNITPAQLSSATCKDNGSTYTIVLKSTGTEANPEVDSEYGKGSAGMIGPLLRTSDVTDAAGSYLTFEGLHAYYHTATTTVTVDKASGHITAFEFNTPCILHFDQVKVAFLKVQNCDIGLLFTQKVSVSY